MSRAAILVLGMHRSGTSALTWLVSRLGAALPADLMPATGENEKGYWESEALVSADDQLLRVCRSSWFDPRPLDWSRLPPDGLASRKRRMREAIELAWGDAALLAIKDPRQCRFVPVVLDVLREMAIEPRPLIMLRSAAEIARSLESRDGTSAAYAHLLWLRHAVDAERWTRGLRRAVVDYAAMLGDWRGTLARVAPLTGGAAAIDEDCAAEIDAFVDPALRHHRIATAALEEPLAGIVAAVEAALAGLLDDDGPAAHARLDAAYALLDAVPWLEGDIVHAEVRHRRMVPAAPDEPQSDPLPAPIPPAEPGDAAALIRDSGLFDADWYRAHYPDAAASGLDPAEHYLRIGAARGYNPGPLFDTGFYARQMARRIAAEEARR